MVRRIRSCSGCQNRFVSEANKPLCCLCETAIVSTEENLLHSPSKRVKVSPTTLHTTDEPTTLQHHVTVDLEVCDDPGDDDNDSISLGGSEGGDDFHCTQIVVSDEEVEDAEGYEQAQPMQECNNVSFPPPESDRQNLKQTDNKLDDAIEDKDVCLICGASWSKLKRRIDHIKRCSKKHHISGRDVKLNDDFESFVPQQDTTTTSLTLADKNTNMNPYTKESDWHGEASIDLQLAEPEEPHTEECSSSSKPAETTTQKQTSLSSFFQAPVRSLNKVLLAGARRVSKYQELVQKQEKKNNGKRPAGSFQRRNYSKACPAYKKITGTDLVCDGFYYARSNETQNYFLTHFHSDHYGGISKSWNHGTIYCSLPTATLVAQQLGVDKKFIHPLPAGPTVIASRGKPVTVTLLDANHCPGAVMFLFEVGKRTILHVGDFRWNRGFMQKQRPLQPFFAGERVLDELFLDTTYCDPKYDLPSQHAAIQAVLSKFKAEKDKPFTTLHLFGAYTIGKEKMYLSVAEHFGMKVYVDSARYRILSALNWPKERMQLLTKNKEEASIWVVPLGDINMKKMPGYLPMANAKPFGKVYDRIVGYRPTGWSMGGKPSSKLISSRTSGNCAIHSVPYSEHSSFPELLDCLECLKPRRIIPTVSVSKSAEQVSMLLNALKQKQTTLGF